jgi:hypothetical protein
MACQKKTERGLEPEDWRWELIQSNLFRSAPQNKAHGPIQRGTGTRTDTTERLRANQATGTGSLCLHLQSVASANCLAPPATGSEVSQLPALAQHLACNPSSIGRHRVLVCLSASCKLQGTRSATGLQTLSILLDLRLNR